VTINTKDFVPRRDDDDDEVVDAQLLDEREAERGRLELPNVDAILAEHADVGNYVLLDRWEMQTWTFLDRLEYADAGLVSIKQRFGGGKFRMRIMGDDSQRKKQVVFRISGRSKDGDESAYTASAILPAPVNDDAETIRDLRAKLDAKKNGDDSGASMQSKLMDAIVMRMLEPPKTDPLVATLLKAVVENKAGGEDVSAVQLQKLLSEARAEGYKQGRELGEALATAVGEGDPVARVLATTLPSVIDAFTHAQEAYKTARPNPPARPAMARVTEPAASPVPEITEEIPVSFANGPVWINALRPAVPMLVKLAHAGKDPAIKAANMVDDLNDDIREIIAIQAESSAFVQTVIDSVPEFQAEDVKPWIVAFLSTIQQILTDEIEGEIPLPGENAEIAEA
jgi:hypothetical protein